MFRLWLCISATYLGGDDAVLIVASTAEATLLTANA